MLQQVTCSYRLGMAPSKDASDHQEDGLQFLSIGNHPKINLYFPLESWGATTEVRCWMSKINFQVVAKAHKQKLKANANIPKKKKIWRLIDGS